LHREEGRKMATIPKMAERQEAERLWNAAEAAQAAYDNYCEQVQLRWVDDGNDGEYQAVRRCAVSGVALLTGDETVRDDETGDTYLRCAVGLPPRPPEEVEEPEKKEAA
jgi:hypothetical protein